MKEKENWSSRTGVILAVTGSAVGLANFIRFPGNVAQFGGGAFMLAYFLSLLVVAIPIAWAEWTMGRYGGQRGFSACPGIFNAIKNHPASRLLGVLGVLVPLIIYMYYSYIEAWCLGYALNLFTQSLEFPTTAESKSFWVSFIGAAEDGSAIGFGFQQVGGYLVFAFLLNFTLVYRGISKGIEKFCRIAVPTLIILALIVLIRALTLGTPDDAKPHQNIQNGLGFMWNPSKVYLEELKQDDSGNFYWDRGVEVIGDEPLAEVYSLADNQPEQYRVAKITTLDQLKRPKLWLAAASQVFFSLSVGLGLIITYSSYMRKDDDVVLSSLAAASANEFCEVGIGGLLTIPAAFAFLGAAGLAGQASSIFALTFNVLPNVFFQMEGGHIFGGLFFFLLFLAAVNASISCLQPSIAFFEETLGTTRKLSVPIVGMLTAMGCGFVVWFSKDAKALDTLDFWAGNFLVFIIATVQIIFFGWVFGVDKGFEEMHKGAAIRIPNFFKFVVKYICPCFLLTIFVMWVAIEVFGLGGTGIDSHILDLIGTEDTPPNHVAWISVAIILFLYAFLSLIALKAPSYNNTKSKD